MSNGLDNVVVAETILSNVDGEAGRLTIRGYSLDGLVGQLDFCATTHLLFDGFFTDLPDPTALAARLGAARTRFFDRMPGRWEDFAVLPVYDGMRAAVAQIPDGDTLDTALELVAAPAVATAALLRIAAGKPVIAPDASLGHAYDVVRMLGTAAAERAALARALDTYLVTVCDHGLNASTFAARVVASTQAGLTSAVLAGMSALIGPLHGGAPGPVIEMLDTLAKSPDPQAWLEAEVQSGARLMGFGHRIYRVRDPRADALKMAVCALSGEAAGARITFAEAMESKALDVLRVHKPGRVLETNVEFFTALLLEAVGFPPAAFTCIFGMGRVIGWIAHAREQQATGRLLRPQSRYIGPGLPLAA